VTALDKPYSGRTVNVVRAKTESANGRTEKAETPNDSIALFAV